MKAFIQLCSLFLCCFILLGLTLSAQKSVKKQKPPRLPEEVRKSFAYVPLGYVYIQGDSALLDAFFISKYEVSNADYNTFLSDVAASGKSLDGLRVDTTDWPAHEKDLARFYISHKAYSDHPVICISHKAAMAYCQWLEEKLNSKNDNSAYTFKVRLPTRPEWIRAACPNARYAWYSWGTRNLRGVKGMYLCNFDVFSDENIHFNPVSNRIERVVSDTIYNRGLLFDDYGGEFTAPVKWHYPPNIIGLYQMNGNVAEMVSEEGIAVGGGWRSFGYDVRNESVLHYTKPATDIGFRPVIIAIKKAS